MKVKRRRKPGAGRWRAPSSRACAQAPGSSAAHRPPVPCRPGGRAARWRATHRRQAVQLNLSPRFRIIQTSSEEIGQIYVPAVNWGLLIMTVALVLGFRSSSALASAYGVAVTTTMVITTVLLFFLVSERWRWNVAAAGGAIVLFMTADLSFFGANMLKVHDGGWFPLAVGVSVFTLMTTWRRGREILAERLLGETGPLEDFLAEVTALLSGAAPAEAAGE